MITNIRAIIVVAALGALAAFCGCTNEPGAPNTKVGEGRQDSRADRGDAATAKPRVGPERREEPEPDRGGILAAPPRRFTQAALVRGFDPDGCRHSSEPQAHLPEAVANNIELARAALERKKLLPPEWILCAAQAADGSWWVRCTPHGKALRAAWVPITVLIRDGKIEDTCEFQIFDPDVSDRDEP